MSYKTIITFLTAATLFTACNNQAVQKEQQVKDLYAEVMEIHDDVMPKMADIQSQKDKTNGFLLDSAWHEAHPEYLDQLRKNLIALSEAEDRMWDWMHNFSDRYGQLNDAGSQLLYLNEQKDSISTVRDVMLRSIEASANLLSQKPFN